MVNDAATLDRGKVCTLTHDTPVVFEALIVFVWVVRLFAVSTSCCAPSCAFSPFLCVMPFLCCVSPFFCVSLFALHG